ncbi:MAG TPA: FHA domain-containing serine/threonine-protein kinase, partial [Terriglobales bacterium]|nr:FHA domain-containing serine/threonine-protein kinase [Terriglobales bacterium]
MEDGATQLFKTRPAAPASIPETLPAAAAASGEATALFVVSRPGSEPGGSPAGGEEAPADTVLTISNCGDSVLLGSKVVLQRFPFTIGRSDADWKLPFDAAVSARHAEIDYRQGGFFIRDLNSANGTFVSGKRLPSMRHEVLLFGARILLGSNTELVFGPGKLQEIPDLQGQLVGNRFTLLEKLHSSAKSVLYLARDEHLSRQVVVKLLSPSFIRHAGYREQFSREAHTASLLRHTHICQVLDHGELGMPGQPGMRSPYVCMEYLPGGSIQARLNQAEAIPLDRIAAWLDTICDALAYIHARGVIHAGIKPSAIVFDAEDSAYLTDFAFAISRGDGERHIVAGAPAFLAPEQWEGADAVPATDQYSLAVLFYWLTAGMPPFEGQEHFAIRKRNLQRGPEPVHAIAAQNGRVLVPPALSAVLQKALAVKAAERFPNAADFAAAFRLALSAPAAAKSGPPSVFISYQRAVSSAWALLLKREMEREHGFQVFVDAEQQDSTGQFPLKLQR